MKIAITQINTVIGDFPLHYKKIVDSARKAVDKGCDLIVFPEMVISGYPPQDLLENDDFVQANLDCLDRLIDTIQGIGVICGFVDRNPEFLRISNHRSMPVSHKIEQFNGMN